MRNMNFSLTTDQIRQRSKTVTRRLGWSFLKPGDLVQACVKCMGLKAGEKIERLCVIRIVTANREQLDCITAPDVKREGFPKMSTIEFVGMFCEANKCAPCETITRIEFEYVD